MFSILKAADDVRSNWVPSRILILILNSCVSDLGINSVPIKGTNNAVAPINMNDNIITSQLCLSKPLRKIPYPLT